MIRFINKNFEKIKCIVHPFFFSFQFLKNFFTNNFWFKLNNTRTIYNHIKCITNETYIISFHTSEKILLLMASNGVWFKLVKLESEEKSTDTEYELRLKKDNPYLNHTSFRLSVAYKYLRFLNILLYL